MLFYNKKFVLAKLKKNPIQLASLYVATSRNSADSFDADDAGQEKEERQLLLVACSLREIREPRNRSTLVDPPLY